jgi:GTP 3',8-cyclase
MPAEGMVWKPKKELLSYEEVARLVHIFAGLGITHIRLTGGEPTLREDICALVESLAQVSGIKDISMTTNGIKLPKLAMNLRKAGLNRINISMDSLDPERFKTITRGIPLSKVLDGIEAARSAGFSPIKINAVMLKDVNEDEIFELVDFCGSKDLELRFIEYMPFEARWHRCVTESSIKTKLMTRFTLIPGATAGNAGPARIYRLKETYQTIGFISPLSQKFCSGCNRLRLMADGHLRTCLAHEDTPSLKSLLRGSYSDDTIESHIVRQVLGKPEGHGCEVEAGIPFQGVMTGIGG